MKQIRSLFTRGLAVSGDARGSSSLKTREAPVALRLNAAPVGVSAAANEQVDALLARLRTSREGLSEEEAEALSGIRGSTEDLLYVVGRNAVELLRVNSDR